jgi:hypothetical protein
MNRFAFIPALTGTSDTGYKKLWKLLQILKLLPSIWMGQPSGLMVPWGKLPSGL